MADMVTTVSETYAKEILTPQYDEGLGAALYHRRNVLYGIVNGIDYDAYNPEKDPYVKYNYNITNVDKIRPENKKILQEESGLKLDAKAFSMGIVSRLTDQKGYDLLKHVMNDFFDAGAQLYVLGSGEYEVENIFRAYQGKYPEQVYFEPDYNDATAKMIYAGCDATIMPSRFEPCGLNQLMALRYGCVPIVRKTGGLADTVIAEEENQTGFVFEDFDSNGFVWALNQALSVYQESPEKWQEIIRRGMEQNYSWKKSAETYEHLYDQLIENN